MANIKKTFGFYLDAVAYCRALNIDLGRIKRKNWGTWMVTK